MHNRPPRAVDESTNASGRQVLIILVLRLSKLWSILMNPAVRPRRNALDHDCMCAERAEAWNCGRQHKPGHKAREGRSADSAESTPLK
jgi:hypothetical protein